jgi:hypothetical protein
VDRATWWAALLGLAGVLVSSVLLYRATRLRDRPAIEAATKAAREEGIRAVSEAWAELSERQDARLARADERLDECQVREERLEAEVRDLKRRLAEVGA